VLSQRRSPDRRPIVAVTIRTSAVGRLPALVLLLLLMTSLFAAPPSVTAGALEATIDVAESVRNGPASPDMLVEPLANPVVETRFAAVAPEMPRTLTILRTRTHQVLRL
jgi:hypothetical protein